MHPMVAAEAWIATTPFFKHLEFGNRTLQFLSHVRWAKWLLGLEFLKLQGLNTEEEAALNSFASISQSQKKKDYNKQMGSARI